MNIAKIIGLGIFSGTILLSGCGTVEETVSAPAKMKFDRLFCWGSAKSEEQAARYAAAGVTDIIARNKNQHDLARKYGMNSYWNVFLPVGPHHQVMTPEEEKHFAYVTGKDLAPKMPRAERMKILHKRRIETRHRYGWEPVAETDTLSDYRPFCFISDDDLKLTKKALDRILETAPADSAGMMLDFLGYMNFRGCFCESCLSKYGKYLSDRKLKDTAENKTAFYREKLVEYYNRVIDHIKSRRPDYKVGAHIYPYFKGDPLYGNLTKTDLCGQTVSWYFKADEAAIRKNTEYVVKHAKDHYSNAEGFPFIGLSTDRSHSLGSKTPEEVDFELRTILAAGGRNVMVCYGPTILEDGYFEVFRKYCGKE